MGQEYLTFVESLNDLPEGKEVELTIKDLTPRDRRYKYDARLVKALVSKDPKAISGADILRVRFRMGVLHPQPYGIKITKELGQFKPKAE